MKLKMTKLWFALTAFALALSLSACAPQPAWDEGFNEPEPAETQKSEPASSPDFKVTEVPVGDGTTVTCVTWGEYDYWTETMKSGMSCF